MDADGDGEIVLFCAILQTEDEFRGCDWFAELEATRSGDVVCRLRRKKNKRLAM